MHLYNNGLYNPTPISKFIVTVFLAMTLPISVNEIFTFIMVLFIALFFLLNSKKDTAVKIIILYLLIYIFVMFMEMQIPIFLKTYILSFVAFIKLFFLPILAGKFLIDTSDVSSITASMRKLKISNVLIIPVAVMFRYFPAFKNDRKNIKRAMKMRGISFKNPLKYLEYVSVPMLISASSIGDDISKSAETKCIADPCNKSKYFDVKFSLIDIIFIGGILILHLFGRLYA